MESARASVKAIIFDWAGVFCSPGEPFAHPELQKQTGLSVDQMSARMKEPWEDFYRGTVASEEFWQGVLKEFSLKGLSTIELREAYLASYHLYPEMFSLAQEMRSSYKTALLSNLTDEMMQKILEVHAVDRYFDYVFFSNKIGYLKPEPESFAYALRMLGTKPEETLFIDDSKKNIEAAAKSGMQTLLFTSPTQCEEELRRRTSARTNNGTL